MFNFSIINQRTLAVLKRELREKLFSKSFLIMTFLIPIFMFGVIGIQTLLMAFSDDETASIQVISNDPEILNGLKTELEKSEAVKEGGYKIHYKQMDKKGFDLYIQKNKARILQERLTGIIYAGKEAVTEKNIEYYSQNPNNKALFSKLKEPINKALVSIYFEDKDLKPSDLKVASNTVDFKGYRISEKQGIKEEGYGNLILSYLFTFLLYTSLLFLGTLMMRSVVEEKNNRIVELLLSSVNTSELMAGKILGVSITGLIQMIIWLSPLVILLSTSIFLIPPEMLMKLSVWQLVYFLYNFFIGLVSFTGLFAMVGAIFNNDQDAQSGIWPVMLLIMIPFFIALSLQNNPNTAIAKTASLLPFASIMVMPARMALVEIPLWHIVSAILINLITMFVVVKLSAKLYRIGILMTGKKPRWSEIVSWVKYKY